MCECLDTSPPQSGFLNTVSAGPFLTQLFFQLRESWSFLAMVQQSICLLKDTLFLKPQSWKHTHVELQR